ncbi:uncharacterized protein LOC110463884 [Mizuhopecten yessoensis]|uniref:uncharacterized protein LOC110463884 n=1 Tax=Mizuhopecten yessoensis TaxID=6573 RepID=UPI000B45BBDB|nr:uncharacterized protein LOC110463884 [Mizuhopecten yessoensis]
MVKICSAYDCTNRANPSAKEQGISFLKFSTNKHKRRSWIRSINRKDFKETAVVQKEREKGMLNMPINKIKDDDKATTFYTGLPSFAVFLWLFNYLSPKAERMTFWGGKSTSTTDRQRPMKTSVPLIDQFLAVLMRLKIGLFVQDMADRFSISKSTFSNMFVT